MKFIYLAKYFQKFCRMLSKIYIAKYKYVIDWFVLWNPVKLKVKLPFSAPSAGMVDVE